MSSVRHGVGLGLVVWVAYGVVESVFAAFVPWLIPPHRPSQLLHYGSVAALFVIYGLCGAIFGGLWGWVVGGSRIRLGARTDRNRQRLLEAGALIGVLTVFAMNFGFSHSFLGIQFLVILSVCVALSGGVLIRACSQRWTACLRLITDPWTALATVVSLTWLLRQVVGSDDSRLLKGAVAVAFLLAVLGVSASLRTLSRRRHPAIGRSTRRRLEIALIVAATIVLGVRWSHRRRPPLDEGIASTAPAGSYPNIVLIILDTVRADHMSLYGYETSTTPGLVEFSREATVYSHAIAASNWTLPSHASIFTGIYARSHGASLIPVDGGFGEPFTPLPADFYTVAEFLSDLGYATVAVVANHAFLAREYQLNQGFQYYDDRVPLPLLAPIPKLFLARTVLGLLRPYLPQAAQAGFGKPTRTAEAITEEASDLLVELVAKDGPFFLFVNYMDAHWPYLPPPPYDTLAPGKDKTFTGRTYGDLVRAVMTLQRPVLETERQHLISQYDGALAYLDLQLTALITKLRELDLYEETLIIITSDHGEAFGEHNLIGHSVSVYQSQVDVPLIIKFPASKLGEQVDETVSHVDIFPTILDMLDHEVPQQLHGRSLLKPRGDSAGYVVTESYPNAQSMKWAARYDRTERAIFAKGLKLIRSSNGERELYSLEKDPNEQVDRIDDMQAEASVLEGLLDLWLTETKAHQRDVELEVDEQTLERLRALGYIQ